MCCTQAKLALRAGGAPYCQRLSSLSRSPPQSEMLNGRIGEDVVGLEVGVAVVVEGVTVADLAVDAANGEVHLGEPPGGVVRLLAEDADVGELAAVGLDELLRLHEHAGGAAAGVVHATLVGLEHLDQQLHHAARRVELATLLALGARELGKEVLVHAAEHVLGARLGVAHLDVADHVDELAKAGLVERRAGVVLGQYALQRSRCRARWPPWRRRRAGQWWAGRPGPSGAASAPRAEPRRC